MNRVLVLTVTGLALALAGCSQLPGAKRVEYNTDLPMNELMGHVIDPAAWAYWRGSGTEITAEGERDLSPTTEEGWLVVENGAATLIEAGNLLQMPGRPRAPEADWNRYSKQLTERAMVARAAAERKDKQAVFDEGGRVYEVCQACHKQFIIDAQENAQGSPGKK
jgi:hypothetical protein